MKINIWMRRVALTCMLSVAMIMGTVAFAEDGEDASLADDAVSEESVESEAWDDEDEIDTARDEKQETADSAVAESEAADTNEDDSANEDDEPYLSETDQDALLDTNAEKVIESEIATERKADAMAAGAGANGEATAQEDNGEYIVRVEVYARPGTPYIPVGELPLQDGFFSWFHDGKRQNGYAVFMYPATNDKSAIELVDKGAVCIYGKSFGSVEEASQEIQGPDTKFHGYITYKPVVDMMLSMLQKPPYQEDAVYDNEGATSEENNVDEADEANSTDEGAVDTFEDDTDNDSSSADADDEGTGDEGNTEESSDMGTADEGGASSDEINDGGAQ